MKRHGKWAAAAAVAIAFTSTPLPLRAQQNSSVMWGTIGNNFGSGGYDNAASHLANGSSAGQVEAARAGWLLGPNINVTAIGVQNIVTVQGNDNNISAGQTGTNSGSVSNSGRVISGN